MKKSEAGRNEPWWFQVSHMPIHGWVPMRQFYREKKNPLPFHRPCIVFPWAVVCRGRQSRGLLLYSVRYTLGSAFSALWLKITASCIWFFITIVGWISLRLLGEFEARFLKPLAEFLAHSGPSVTGRFMIPTPALLPLDLQEKKQNSQQMATNWLLPENHSRWIIDSLGKILPLWD